MEYTWDFSKKFAIEFNNVSREDQDKILDFTEVYENEGLSNFSNYEGKITPSWSGSNISLSDYSYAYNNALWHYHIGIPSYQEFHSRYKTSDWLLHFQWIGRGCHITIVDLYSHYTSDGNFYLPPETYIEE